MTLTIKLIDVSTQLILPVIKGLEAVIDDLKNGRVTLRRRQNHPRVPISPKENYTTIYQLLEKNQQQNRKSKKILENELSTVFKKFNINI